MSILAALETIRSPFLNQVILLLTNLGDEAAVYAVGLFIFWCVDKRRGYQLIRTCFAAMGCCFLLKDILAVPRPWVRDSSLTPVNVQASNASDFSMPSGHAANSASMYGLIGLTVRQKALKVLLLLAPLLVAFTRLYLGVHTPEDVLAGLALGYATAGIFYALSDKLAEVSFMRRVDIVLLALLAGILVYLHLKTPADDTEAACIASSIRDTCSLFGAMLGVIFAGALEQKRICFSTKAVWWAQLLKLVLGMAVVLALRVGLKSLFALILPDCVYTNIPRYFILVFVAIAVWPMTFSWFAGMGKRK